MFDKLGQIASLMKNLPKIQEEMAQLQTRIPQITAEGDAGAGLVKAKVNGRNEVIACNISDELLKMNDKELLEDLVRAAITQALQKVRVLVAEETAKMAGGMGINMPPDFRLPS
jgi:nucleoid-associated protein EbfC